MSNPTEITAEYRGVAFRNVSQRFATTLDALSTRGSRAWGGRFNVATEFGVLYLSCDLQTCLNELEHAARYEGVFVEEKLPRTIVGVRVILKNVLDLTNPLTRKKLKLSKRILIDTEWIKENVMGKEAATQIIGRVAKAAGFEAILVPSARCSGKNLNLIDDGSLLDRAAVVNANLLATKTVRKICESA
jgi:RES domain-containing protein